MARATIGQSPPSTASVRGTSMQCSCCDAVGESRLHCEESELHVHPIPLTPANQRRSTRIRAADLCHCTSPVHPACGRQPLTMDSRLACISRVVEIRHCPGPHWGHQYSPPPACAGADCRPDVCSAHPHYHAKVTARSLNFSGVSFGSTVYLQDARNHCEGGSELTARELSC